MTSNLSGNPTKASLIEFVNRWDEAMIENNAMAIGKFMSDDWVIVGTEGGITTREAFLESIRCSDLFHSRMDADETHITLYGTTGVVISKGTSAGTFRAKPFSLYEWSTSVFIFDGAWKCVTTMLTPAHRDDV